MPSEAALRLELPAGEREAGRALDARRGGASLPGRRDERLDACRADEQVVVQQHGVPGAVEERALQAGIGPAGEAAVVAQAQDDGVIRSVDARSVPCLVVDQNAPRERRDFLEARQTGAGPFAGAPRDDDCSNAHRRRVYPRRAVSPRSEAARNLSDAACPDVISAR